MAEISRRDLPASVLEKIKAFSGEVGLYAHHLPSSTTLRWQADRSFPTASTIKVAIMATAFMQAETGRLSLSTPLRVESEDQVGGTGVLRGLTSELQLPVIDLIYLMIAVSDNTATNTLLRALGLETLNAFLDQLQLPGIRLHRPVTFAKVDGAFVSIGSATPQDFGRLLENMAAGQLVSAAASRYMLQMLRRQQHRDYIPRWLPVNELVAESGEVPQWWCANKPGFMPGIRNDMAILGRESPELVVVVLTAGSRQHREDPDSEGALTIAGLARDIWEQYQTASNRD